MIVNEMREVFTVDLCKIYLAVCRCYLEIGSGNETLYKYTDVPNRQTTLRKYYTATTNTNKHNNFMKEHYCSCCAMRR